MDRKSIIKSLAVVSTFSLLGINSIAFADGEGPIFYGKFNLSLNSIDDGNESNLTVGSNDSKAGFKGTHKLPKELELIYQLEMEFDSTERNGFSGGRNSFVGVKGSYGKLILGQYDTPLKDIRENGAELFDDTIAGSRSIISAVSGMLGAELDDRAKNAIMYTSPSVNNTEVAVLYSTDMDPGDETVDNNDNDLVSANIVHVNGPLYVGVGYEKKSQTLLDPGLAASDDLVVTRLGFSYDLGQYKVGGIFESADAGDNSLLTRDAFEVNFVYKISEQTWAGIQIGQVDDYDGSTDTGATNISVGVEHTLDDNTSVYVVATSTDNDNNAQYGLAQGGNQDRVVAAAPGDKVTGIATGVAFKF